MFCFLFVLLLFFSQELWYDAVACVNKKLCPDFREYASIREFLDAVKEDLQLDYHERKHIKYPARPGGPIATVPNSTEPTLPMAPISSSVVQSYDISQSAPSVPYTELLAKMEEQFQNLNIVGQAVKQIGDAVQGIQQQVGELTKKVDDLEKGAG